MKTSNHKELLNKFKEEVNKEFENSQIEKRNNLYKSLYKLGEKYYEKTKS